MRLRDARIRQGLTQTEAAQKCGLSQSQFSRVESGVTSTWTPQVRAGVAEILVVSLGMIEELLSTTPERDFARLLEEQRELFLAVKDRLEKLTAMVQSLLEPEG